MDTNRKATALVIASPHKVYGPESNDLVLELRKRGISKVLLCGMSANLCLESHLRERRSHHRRSTAYVARCLMEY